MWRRRLIELAIYLPVAAVASVLFTVVLLIAGTVLATQATTTDTSPTAGIGAAVVLMFSSVGVSVALLGSPVLLAAGWALDVARGRFGARPVAAALALGAVASVVATVAAAFWWGMTYYLLPPAEVGFFVALTAFHARWQPWTATPFVPPTAEERNAIGARALGWLGMGSLFAAVAGGGWGLFAMVVATFLGITTLRMLEGRETARESMGCAMIFAMFLGVPMGLVAAIAVAPTALAWAAVSFVGWWYTPRGRRWAWLVADLFLAAAGGAVAGSAWLGLLLRDHKPIDPANGSLALALALAGVGPGLATAFTRLALLPAFEQRLVTAHRARVLAATPAAARVEAQDEAPPEPEPDASPPEPAAS